MVLQIVADSIEDLPEGLRQKSSQDGKGHYVVTNLGSSQASFIYDRIYCARGTRRRYRREGTCLLRRDHGRQRTGQRNLKT